MNNKHTEISVGKDGKIIYIDNSKNKYHPHKMYAIFETYKDKEEKK